MKEVFGKKICMAVDLYFNDVEMVDKSIKYILNLY